MLQRIGLFILTNLAILFVLNIVLALIEPWLVAQGIDVQNATIWIIALAFGMGGALISLALSKTMALRSTGAKIIQTPKNETEQWLMDLVKRQAKEVGIGVPDFAIYSSSEPNAFATGASRNKALVAVSTGLLEHMPRNEVEAVVGHEMAHIANGDMITLTLLQGVLNTFVIVLSRVLGQVIDRVVFKSNRAYGPGYFISVIVMQIVLGVLASMIVMAFSRWREYGADAGGARLAGRANMIGALQTLGRVSGRAQLPESVEAFGIRGRVGTGIKALLMSHPPIESRIQALQEGR